MIFQLTETLRLFLVFVPQLFDSFLFLFLIYKILKRNTNRSSLILSFFYLTVGIGLIINAIALILAFLQMGEIIGFLYFIATYLIILSFIFIVIFVISLLKLKEVFTNKKIFLIVLIYGFAWLILFLFPGGLTFTENWVPVYSWPLFFTATLLYTLSITIPTIYYSTRLYRTFKADNLKKKLRKFLFGITIILPIIYGAILFNTWQDPLFKIVWGILVIVLLLSSGLLIYYGIGREL